MALTRDGLRTFYRDRAAYLDEVIGMGYKEWPELYRTFLNGKTMGGGWTDIGTVSGFGLFTEKPEMVSPDEDDIYEGNTARVAATTFAKQHVVSKEAIEDDMGDGIIAARVPEILKAARATRETLGHDLVNSGFSGVGSTVTTPDGVTLFSASHLPITGTGSTDNLLATDLSESELELAITKLKSMTNDRGIPILQTPVKLLVPTALEWTAAKILQTEQAAGGGDTSVGLIYNTQTSRQGIQLIVSPYITDSDSWFLFGDSHGLNWYDRTQVENYSDVDEKLKAVYVGASFRCAQAATDWRGVVGSPGA